MFRFLCIFISILFLTSCDQNISEEAMDHHQLLSRLQKDTGIRFAKRFAVLKDENTQAVLLFGSKDANDTSAIYIMSTDTSLRILPAKNLFLVKTSVLRIASLSSVYSNMLTETGCTDRIVAVENLDYYNNAELLQKHKSSPLEELSKLPEPDIEKTLAIHPDIVFTFGMGDKGPDERLTKAGIPTVIAADHYETHPLARAEWIKFFAVFTGKRLEADRIFDSVCGKYGSLKKLAGNSKNRPTAFSEIKTGELWYVPGGKSFAATFIKDAGGKYVWQDDEHTGSLALGLEEVYSKAGKADLWFNQALVKNKKELLAADPRYAGFNAFQKGNMFNNTLNCNAGGYSDYWETGIAHPERVLSDLIRIFHPELSDSLNSTMYYYKKLEE